MKSKEINATLKHLLSWSGAEADPTRCESFVKAMADRELTSTALHAAWEWFVLGWNAHDDTVY